MKLPSVVLRAAPSSPKPGRRQRTGSRRQPFLPRCWRSWHRLDAGIPRVEAEGLDRPVGDHGRRAEARVGALPAALPEAAAEEEAATLQGVEVGEGREPARVTRTAPGPGPARPLRGGRLGFYMFSWFVFFCCYYSCASRAVGGLGRYSRSIYFASPVPIEGVMHKALCPSAIEKPPLLRRIPSLCVNGTLLVSSADTPRSKGEIGTARPARSIRSLGSSPENGR